MMQDLGHEVVKDDAGPSWLQRSWSSFWAWFTEPMPFPRDHWYGRMVTIIWDEFDREGDPALPESRAEDPVDSRSPPPF